MRIFFVFLRKMGVNYYPFGWSMPGRKYQEGDYRFGFNGRDISYIYQIVNTIVKMHSKRQKK